MNPMLQVYAGRGATGPGSPIPGEKVVAEATGLPGLLIKMKRSPLTIQPGATGHLILEGPGLGALGDTPWIRDKFAEGYIAQGLMVTDIRGEGLTKFIITWSYPRTLQGRPGVALGPLAIVVVALAVVFVLTALGWLMTKLTATLKVLGGAALGLGGGLLLAAVAAAIFISAGGAKALRGGRT